MHKIFVLLLSLSVLISCSRGQSCEVRGYIIDYDDVYSYFITKYNNIESEYPGFRVENNYLFFESSFLFDNNFSLETNSENSTKYICNYKLKMNSLSGTFQLNAIDNEYIFEIGLNFFWYTTTKETKKILLSRKNIVDRFFQISGDSLESEENFLPNLNESILNKCLKPLSTVYETKENYVYNGQEYGICAV